jgi:hypothetical protein
VRRLGLLVAICLAAGGPLATGAIAAQTPLSDCQKHDRLTQSYTIAQLRSALADMPADQKEYTDCYGVIQNQLFARVQRLRGHGSGGGSGGTPVWVPIVVAVAAVLLVGGGLAAAAARRGGGDGGGASSP